VNAQAEPFERGASAYRDHLRTPRGRLTIDLAFSHLGRHLKVLEKLERKNRASFDVLDVGGGPGDLAVRLVAQGHTVTLVDPSAAMLAIAQEHAIEALTPSDRARLLLVPAVLEDLAKKWPGKQFDLVLCHGTLEYLKDDASAWKSLGTLVRDGGLLSVIVPNRDAHPLHLGARGMMQKAMDALEQRRAEPDLIFGVQRRNYDLEAVRARFAEIGITPVSELGVRVVADFMPETVFTLDYAAVLAYELAMGSIDPYRRIARYLHAIGERLQLEADDDSLPTQNYRDETTLRT